MNKTLAALSIEAVYIPPYAQYTFLPAWLPRLAPMGSRTSHVVRQVRAYTLCQLESFFALWLPKDLFPKASEKENSRDGDYTRQRTFWCMLWREVVRQLQALFSLEGGCPNF